MNGNTPNSTNALLELFDGFYDETLSGEDIDSLAQGLIGDRKSLELFVDYIDFRADLPRCVSESADAPAASPAAPLRVAKTFSAPKVPLAFNRLFQHPLYVSLFIATVTTLSGLLTFSQIRFDGGLSSSTAPAGIDSPTEKEIRFVAQLASDAGCRWGEASEAVFSGAHLRLGQVLDLREGTAKVTFKSGAVALLEGPMVFTLDGENRGRLDRGWLVARVDKRAVGFTVAAPGATLVDLGTEFGVYVDADGATEAYVFQGKIKAVSAPATGERTKPSSTVLGAGQGVRIAADGMAIAGDDDVDSRQFAFRKSHPQEIRPSPPAEPSSNVVLLADDFEGRYLDPNKWTTDLSTSSGGTPSVSLFGGQVNFRDRGYLNTAKDFKPADYNTGKYAGGIKITGRWTFNSPLDHLEISTRSDGSPHGPYGVVRNGVVFAFYHGNPAPGAWAILEQTDGKTAYVVPQTPLSQPISTEVFDFEITDDGVRVSFTVKEVGGRGNSWVLRGETQYVNPRGISKIVFYNRERTTTASCLDNLVIQTGFARGASE